MDSKKELSIEEMWAQTWEFKLTEDEEKEVKARVDAGQIRRQSPEKITEDVIKHFGTKTLQELKELSEVTVILRDGTYLDLTARGTIPERYRVPRNVAYFIELTNQIDYEMEFNRFDFMVDELGWIAMNGWKGTRIPTGGATIEQLNAMYRILEKVTTEGDPTDDFEVYVGELTATYPFGSFTRQKIMGCIMAYYATGQLPKGKISDVNSSSFVTNKIQKLIDAHKMDYVAIYQNGDNQILPTDKRLCHKNGHIKAENKLVLIDYEEAEGGQIVASGEEEVISTLLSWGVFDQDGTAPKEIEDQIQRWLQNKYGIKTETITLELK